MEDAKKRFQERRRGPFFVAGESHLQGGNVPVNQVREYWKPIVGEARPFTKIVELVHEHTGQAAKPLWTLTFRRVTGKLCSAESNPGRRLGQTESKASGGSIYRWPTNG
ncbi:hypothetical protein GCK32_006460 [Trichostrongylus colubriformis]|uniref:Uncharacterized protein n=1 Tax=Trichostrongylus colubriformis TaxID=6319 RepID=A0AAN8F4B1_TRICO